MFPYQDAISHLKECAFKGNMCTCGKMVQPEDAAVAEHQLECKEAVIKCMKCDTIFTGEPISSHDCIKSLKIKYKEEKVLLKQEKHFKKLFKDVVCPLGHIMGPMSGEKPV